MEIIVVDDLFSALRLYDFNKNTKNGMVLEFKTHNIQKEERERERNLGWNCCYEKSKTCKLYFVEFVSPRVNLNHISYFFFKDGVTW